MTDDSNVLELGLRKFVSLNARLGLGIQRRLGRFAGKKLMNAQEGNAHIFKSLQADKPFMLTRLGSSELGIWHNHQGVIAQRHGDWLRLKSRMLAEPAYWLPEVMHAASNNAGFFPASPENMSRYAIEFENWLIAADMLAVMQLNRVEQSVFRKCARLAVYTAPMGLEPYIHAQPWTHALQGKTVLVVHPFAKSIVAQYPKRELIFGETPVLPAFELKVIRAEQTLGGKSDKFADWFAALDAMREKISALDFDVAIIGAGAYGLPLAAHIKQLGKQAIHLGGSTQILFGIRGKRWDDRTEVSRYYNAHWVRPLPEETPENARRVEGACYW